MNKLETYSDLSFNFETDFELMLMESMIDDAECEARSAHLALEAYLDKKNGYSIDGAVENLIAVLEGTDKDCCDDEDYDDKKYKKKKKDDEDDEDEEEDDDEVDEDAKESYLRYACEAADASLGQKIAAGWKVFKEKVIAFLSRIANALKNVATKFQVILTRKAKNNVNIPEGDRYILKSMDLVRKKMNEISISDVNKSNAATDDIGVHIEKASALNKNNTTVQVSPSEIKSYLSSVSETLKLCQKTLTKLDREVNAKIRSGDTDARNSMADARSQITSVMSVIRKATSAIVSAVSKAGKKSENGKNNGSTNEDIEHVDAEIV